MPADRSPALPRLDPGAGLDATRVPGHFLLARLGKRVLRPGGITMPRRMLDGLDIQAGDRVWRVQVSRIRARCQDERTTTDHG